MRSAKKGRSRSRRLEGCFRHGGHALACHADMLLSRLVGDRDGWLVTGAYSGGELQRYWVSASRHAARAGYFELSSSESPELYGSFCGDFSTGAILRNVAYARNGVNYWANNDGKLLTYYGLNKIDGAWRYFDETTGAYQTYSQVMQRVFDASKNVPWTGEAEGWQYSTVLANAGGRYCEYGPCMSFIWYCFDRAGVGGFFADGLISGWPHEYYDWFAARGRVTSNPTVGSVVFWSYPWNQQLGLSVGHSELVIAVNGDGTFTTIGHTTGGVYNRVHDRYGVIGFGLPAYC